MYNFNFIQFVVSNSRQSFNFVNFCAILCSFAIILRSIWYFGTLINFQNQFPSI